MQLHWRQNNVTKLNRQEITAAIHHASRHDFRFCCPSASLLLVLNRLSMEESQLLVDALFGNFS